MMTRSGPWSARMRRIASPACRPITLVLATMVAAACGSSTGTDDDSPCLVTAIAVNPPAATVIEGDGVFLDVAIAPPACERVVTWTTSDSTVATVSSSGRVFGLSEGTALVKASVDAVSDSSIITVQPPAPMRPRR